MGMFSNGELIFSNSIKFLSFPEKNYFQNKILLCLFKEIANVNTDGNSRGELHVVLGCIASEEDG